MGVMVKICGINSTAAADAVLAAKADFAGLVFHPQSPRNVTLDQARVLAERLRDKIKLVALTAHADDAALEAIMVAVAPDILQLHGNETAQRIAAVRRRFGRAVMPAIAVRTSADIDQAEARIAAADMVLFDAKAPPAAERLGGLGIAFDWTILCGRLLAKPWMLAGGLTPDNVAAAMAASGASCVDVSSGVESAPGVKDIHKIAAFVAAAHTVNS